MVPGQISRPGRGSAQDQDHYLEGRLRSARAPSPGPRLGASRGEPVREDLAHPECPPDVVAEADFTGSTAGMIPRCAKTPKRSCGHRMLHERQRAGGAPGHRFVRPCNSAPHMKRITLAKILDSLVELTTEVTVDLSIAGGRAARSSDDARQAIAARVQRRAREATMRKTASIPRRAHCAQRTWRSRWPRVHQCACPRSRSTRR